VIERETQVEIGGGGIDREGRMWNLFGRVQRAG